MLIIRIGSEKKETDLGFTSPIVKRQK
jgi:hypothetical protein